MDPSPAQDDPEQPSALEPGTDSAPTDSTPTPAPPEPIGGLWSRQWLFLRRRWWNTDSLTFTQRIGSFLRGLILIALGAIGLIIVVNNTLNLNPHGMDGVAKLMAEFLLIPVGILALIIAGYGVSQIVRSFVPNSMANRHLHSSEPLDFEEDQSERFQLRDEDKP